MSGLYNLVHGEHPLGQILVDLLKSKQDVEIGRYRDGWVEHDGDVLLIRIHTRNGGGNREWQADAIESMQAHPWYVRDEDDDFDSTYADFYFAPPLGEIPPSVAKVLVECAQAPVDVGARWQAAIDAISKGGGS